MHKVLQFRSTSQLGGPERQILQLSGAIRGCGFQSELLMYYRRKGSQGELHPAISVVRGKGLVVEQWEDRAWFSPRVVWRLARKLAQGRFALLHTRDYKTNLIGLLAARMAGCPCVATVHLHDVTIWRLKLYRLLDLGVLRLFPRIIAVSEDLRRELLAAGLGEDRVVTIHNAIDAQDFQAQAGGNGRRLRSQWGIDTDQPVISIAGRLTTQKGHCYFLQSARRVLLHQPRACLLIIGDGPWRARLEAMSEELNLGNAVRFLGHQNNVAPLMEMSDVVAMASVREGLPNVILEALALAKPVVATTVGGCPEVIRDGETGLLVPPRDPQVLAEAILYLLGHPEEAAEMGRRGRARILQDFSVEEMARKTAALYREVLRREGYRWP